MIISESTKKYLEMCKYKINGKVYNSLSELLEMEGDVGALDVGTFDATNPDIRFHRTGFHGTPHRFPKEILVKNPDGSQEYLVGTPDEFPVVPANYEVIREFPFGRFRMDKMGTGEGAQAYGWGMYFTELEDIARWYARKLQKTDAKFDGKEVPSYYTEVPERIKAIAQEVVDSMPGGYYKGVTLPLVNQAMSSAILTLAGGTAFGINFNPAKKELQDAVQDSFDTFGRYGYHTAEGVEAALALELIDNGLEAKPNRNLLQVTLHKGKTPIKSEDYKAVGKLVIPRKPPNMSSDDFKRGITSGEIKPLKEFSTPEEAKAWLEAEDKKAEYTWLDWDMIVSDEIIDKVNEAAKSKYGEYNEFTAYVEANRRHPDVYGKITVTGQQFYEEILHNKLWQLNNSDKAASLFLLEAGIDGVKYPAESRTSDKARGFNYVVFDENAVEIEQATRFQRTSPLQQAIANGTVTLQKDLSSQRVPFSFSRGSLSLPEMESRFDDLAQYAKLWKAYNPLKTEEDFFNHVKKDIDRRFTKAFARAAFNNDGTYLAERQRQLRDTYGRGATAESQSVQKALASQYTEPVVKDMLRRNDLLYTKRPHEVTERDAQWVIDTYGELEDIIPYIQELRRRSNIDTAIVLADKVVVLLGRKARETTEQKEKERYWKLQYEVAQDQAMYKREVARGLRASSMYSQMDFDGFVYNINRLKRNARTELSRRFKNTLDAIKEEARKASSAAKYKIMTDEVRTRLVQGTMTRDQIRNAKESAADKLRKKGAPGFSVRATREELKEYGYYTFLGGLVNRQSWVNHMMNKGLTRTEAEQIFDNEDFYGMGTLSQQAALPNVMAAIGTPLMLSELEKILPQDEARQLATHLNNEHARRVNEHLSKSYRKHLSQKGDKGRLVQAVMKAVDQGKFDDDTIINLVADEFGSVDLTDEQLRELKERFDQAMLEPEGRNRDMAMTEVWAWVYNQNRAFSFGDMAWGFYYANMLSGPGTHLLNLTENFIGLSLELSAQLGLEAITPSKGLSKPKVVGAMLRNTFKGVMGVGVRDMIRIWRRGPVDFKSDFKLIEDSAMEALAKSKVKWYQMPAKALAKFWGRYIGRALSAVDALFHAGFYEMSNVIESARVVREEVRLGQLTKEDARQKFRELIGDKSSFDQAINQAKMEMEEVYRQQGKAWIDDLPVGVSRIGQTKNKEAYEQWYKTLTRSREIVLQKRESRAAREGTYHNLGAKNTLFASIGTYTHPPKGVLGAFARFLANFIGEVPAARFVVPFVNIVANVYNRQLDYTPWGALRSLPVKGGLTNLLRPKAAQETKWATSGPEAEIRLLKSLIGTSALIAAFKLFWDEDDEYKEDNVTIHGRGPKDYLKRKELAARGWKPYSMQIGKKFYAFNYTPFALGLSVVANLIDAKRYENLDEKTTGKMALYAFNRLGSTLLSTSFVRSAADFLGFFEEGKEDSDKLLTFAARTFTTLIPLAGSAMLRTIQNSLDDTMYNANNWHEKIQRNIPIAKMYLKPDLNAYGEVITANGASLLAIPRSAAEMFGVNRFISTSKPDEHFSWLMSQEVFPPQIGKSTKIFGVNIPAHAHYEFVRIAGPIIKRKIDSERAFIEGLEFPEERHEYMNDKIKGSVVDDVKFAVLEQFNFEPTEQELAEMKVDWKRVEARVKELNP